MKKRVRTRPRPARAQATSLRRATYTISRGGILYQDQLLGQFTITDLSYMPLDNKGVAHLRSKVGFVWTHTALEQDGYMVYPDTEKSPDTAKQELMEALRDHLEQMRMDLNDRVREINRVLSSL